WSRFDQPDPYDGSYNLSDPQSFNQFSYVQNDPVNMTDPSGLEPVVCGVEVSGSICTGMPGFWGGGFNVNSHTSLVGGSGLQAIAQAEYEHDYRYYPRTGDFFYFDSAFVGAGPWSGFNPQQTTNGSYLGNKGNPNSPECQKLAQKIANIASSIITHAK